MKDGFLDGFSSEEDEFGTGKLVCSDIQCLSVFTEKDCGLVFTSFLLVSTDCYATVIDED